MTTPNSYAGALNGTYNADDPLVAAWWVPGWSAQDKISLLANTSLAFGPGFPTNLSFVQVTGNYFDTNSSPLGGYVTVMMSDNITVLDGGNYFRLPKRYTGTMNQPLSFAYNNWGSERLYIRFGQLNIELFATDQTASGSTVTTDSGNPFFYWVTEHWIGGRRFQITVPSASAPGPVDINSLIVAGTVVPYKYDPVFPDLVSEDYELDTSNAPAPQPLPAPTGFVFKQASASTTWTIVTNLGFNPGGITVIDGSGTIWMPETISYPSLGTVILTFATAVAGTAYLS